MSLKPWKVLETRHVHPVFRIETCELANGSLLDAMILEFRPWAHVVALTKDNEVVLVRQYRHGVRQVVLEFPGGAMEEGEDPAEGIRRELLEETGYIVSRVVEVGRLFPNPALQTNLQYCFLGLDAEKVAAQTLDAGEDIDICLMPLDELIETARRGGFPHALDVAVFFQALLHLGRIG